MQSCFSEHYSIDIEREEYGLAVGRIYWDKGQE